ncbi:MAG: bifunctional glutamate N-acetyltransferase/amino-acid acetyltransferase ArgJ [Desulfobulbaceae bacterium]|nr:bifunctional glutamate N-acetyltransferase/amino-acid acetyltransferase ArgJ [Desulfobulbaceae bacterium]
MQVQGFTAAATAAGIRYANRLDLGLIYSEVPAIAAGVFTTNRVKAAPVQLSMERLRSGKAQAILVNSGNANACTGIPGMEATLATSAMAAQALGIDEALVQVASTGVIGQILPISPFSNAISALAGNLSGSQLNDVARAIMTTDLVEKTVTTTVDIMGTPVTLYGMAKGSGMIRPDMATMLCFILTDAQIVFPVLDRLLRAAVDESFNAITVDGDTSTNDMALILANGLANNPWIDEDNPEGMRAFGDALRAVCQELALKIVADGEGATKLVHIQVNGARTKAEAINAAQTIANSALVKTAFFGEDANWGRIIAALGRSDCHFKEERVDISFDTVLLVERGLCLGAEAEAKATAVLKQKEFTVTVSIHEGSAHALVHTCDFSIDYVKINASYRS